MTTNPDATFDCLAALDQLYQIQWQRALQLMEAEAKYGYLRSVDIACRDCRHLLIAIQKIRFELGIDEYRLGLPVRVP